MDLMNLGNPLENQTLIHLVQETEALEDLVVGIMEDSTEGSMEDLVATMTTSFDSFMNTFNYIRLIYFKKSECHIFD